MALITCPECHASISDKAVACPKCGAPRVSKADGGAPPAKKDGGSVGKALLWVAAGLVVLFFVIGFIGSNSSEGKAKAQARAAIATCWELQGRKSNDPGTARFAAGACERMEADFRQQYGSAP